MSISATIDEIEYNGVDTIAVGGKIVYLNAEGIATEQMVSMIEGGGSFELDIPSVTKIDAYVFYIRNIGLKKAYFENAKSVGTHAFDTVNAYNKSKPMCNLDLYLPNVETIDSYAFQSVFFGNEYIKFEKLTTIGSYAFSGAQNINYMYLPNIKSFGNRSFAGFTTINLIIGTSESSGIATAGSYVWMNNRGYIYVPDHLVDTYKAASNWSTYSSYIKGHSEIPSGVMDVFDEG